MSVSEAGPSKPKRPKRNSKPTLKKYLTEQELEAVLYNSDDDLEDPTFINQVDQTDLSSSDDFEDYLDESIKSLPSTSRSTPIVYDNLEDAIVVTAQLQPNNEVQPPPKPKVQNPIVKGNKEGVLRKFPFTKINKLLVTDLGKTSMDFFNLMFDDDFYDLIIKETNRYAVEIFLSKEGEHSRITKWKPVTKEELKIFIGLFFHMGTIHLARIQDYWKTDRLFNLHCFSDYMSRDRFLIILRCLHFSQNPREGEAKPADRLFKIRPVIDYFNTKMNNIYYPDKNLAIDESMVLWRGRLQFRQYIQNKRHKYGIKLYMLTEPNGIILKFSVYTGAFDDQGGKGHAAKVVLNLMEGKLNVGHSLFIDNFYNSFDLSLNLLSKNTYSTGTLRVDRKNNPPEVKSSKLRKGETIARYSNGVMIGRWHDKRDVNYISTEFSNVLVQYQDKRGNEKSKPLPIIHYNNCVGGVDRQDQFMAYYPCARITVRWYKKIGLHIMQLLLLNSFLLYKKFHAPRRSFYDFRLEIIGNLLPAQMQKPRSVDLVLHHFASHCPKSAVGGKTLRKKCKQCSSQGKRKDTVFECKTCNVGLCLEPCFQQYHESQKHE